MRIAKFSLMLLCLVALFGPGYQVSAQDDYVDYLEVMSTAETTYKQDYYARNQFVGTPDTIAWTLPALSVGVNVFPDEATAEAWMDFMIGPAMGQGGDLETIDDLGDEAYRFIDLDAPIYAESISVRDGDVVFYANTTVLSPHKTLGEDMIRFMMERGPSDAPVALDEQGSLTGGWIDAFATRADISELEDYESPVVTITSNGHPQQATPVGRVAEHIWQ